MGGIILGILFLLIAITLVRCIRIVQQAKAYVIEFLGAYKTTWNVGIHFKLPIVERVAKIVSLKEQVADFPPQPVITKDNVTMQIDTVIYFQITDPKMYTYGIEQPIVAIENLAATTLRNIIGDLELDQCLTSLIKKAISLGVAKINVNTECQLAFADATRKYVEAGKDLEGKGFDPRKLLAPGAEAIKATVKEKMELFGSVGKA